DHVARIGIAEQRARTLIEHIRIEPIGFQQRHPAFPALPLSLGLVEFSREGGNLLLEVDASGEPIFAGIGIGAEISDQTSGHDVKDDSAEKSAQARTSNHGGTMRVAP